VSDFGRHSRRNDQSKGLFFSSKQAKKWDALSYFKISALHILACCLALVMAATGLWAMYEIKRLDVEIGGLLSQSQALIQTGSELEAQYFVACNEKNLQTIAKKFGLGPAGAGQRIVIEE